MSVVSFLLASIAVLMAVPVTVFCIEVLASVFRPRRLRSPSATDHFRPRVAVLVPAHNESKGLLNTLHDIQSQLHEGDRLLIVADNCTDDTASVAASAGAEVTVRCDTDRVGKGYALDWGIRYLGADPTDVVIIIDADCRLAKDTIKQLATTCWSTGRAAQALYLMTAPDGMSINYRVAEFAWRVKNWLRPLGLATFGLPCQLMGTGMAFPWVVIASAKLATGSLVEDMKLGLDLARSGNPPLFCPSAGVTSQFPVSSKGAQSQRKRWEQGHIGMITTQVPSLLFAGLSRRNIDLLALALDVAVPPITMLMMLVCLMFIVSALGYLLGLSSAALLVSGISFLALSISVILGWLNFGRDILPLNSIWLVAIYAAKKLSLYRQIVSQDGGSQWIRTDRESIGKGSDDSIT